MPGATAASEVEPVRPMSSKARMMPQTVPKRPMNGVEPAVVARNAVPRASTRPSLAMARRSERSTASSERMR